LASGVTLLQVGRVDDAHAPALHLLEESAALHRAHEHYDLQRLDVGVIAWRFALGSQRS
jgi:hypothetical protein